MAEQAQQPGRLGAWVPVYASAGIPWAPSPQGMEVSAIMCKTAGHPTRRKFYPRASKNHRGGYVCPQAYAGVRKRTCVGGSLQAPGLIMFWARVRKTAGPLKCEKNSPIKISERQ